MRELARLTGQDAKLREGTLDHDNKLILDIVHESQDKPRCLDCNRQTAISDVTGRCNECHVSTELKKIIDAAAAIDKKVFATHPQLQQLAATIASKRNLVARFEEKRAAKPRVHRKNMVKKVARLQTELDVEYDATADLEEEDEEEEADEGDEEEDESECLDNDFDPEAEAEAAESGDESDSDPSAASEGQEMSKELARVLAEMAAKESSNKRSLDRMMTNSDPNQPAAKRQRV